MGAQGGFILRQATGTALVTGGTDGIGRETALQLARHGYTLHVVGRNVERGEATLEQLRSIGPERQHKFFRVDLALLGETRQFLGDYRANHDTLDLLILNANAVTGKISATPDGIETTFAVGYVSRYLFSLQLDALLARAGQSRVVHIGGTLLAADIPYDKLSEPRFGVLRATSLANTADTFMVHYLHELALTAVPHEMVTPGVVNTRQVRERPWVVRTLARLLGMIEPEEAGKGVVKHILETDAAAVAGKAFHLEKPRSVRLGRGDPLEKCRRLVAFTESFSGVKVADYLAPASAPQEEKSP